MERTTIISYTLAEKTRAASLWRAIERVRANTATPQVLIVVDGQRHAPSLLGALKARRDIALLQLQAPSLPATMPLRWIAVRTQVRAPHRTEQDATAELHRAVRPATAQGVAGGRGCQADQQHARFRLRLDAGRQRSAQCHRHHGASRQRDRLPALRQTDRFLRQPVTGVQVQGPAAAQVLQGRLGNLLSFWSHAHHAYFRA